MSKTYIKKNQAGVPTGGSTGQVLKKSSGSDFDYAWDDESGGITGSGTTNQLAYWTSSSTIASLSTATYPSLTEISYVKGVTSSIQSQLNSKISDISGFDTDDLTEGSTNLYYTNTRARASISLTTTGSGAASYNNTTGVLNIPTTDLSGYVPYTGATTALDLGSNNISAATGNFSSNVIASGNFLTSSSVRVAATQQFYWQTRSVIKSPADGQITLYDSTTADFGLLQFGGISSSYPALKRSTTAIQVRLADDSAYTNLEVVDDAYGAGWSGSKQVPTKGDLYTKIESLGGGGSQTPWTSNINAAGYTLYGNSSSGGNLTIGSTSNATKGKILFGSSAYNETTNALIIGATTNESGSIASFTGGRLSLYKGTEFSYADGSQTDFVVSNSAANSRFLFGQSISAYGGMVWNYNATPSNATLDIGVNVSGVLTGIRFNSTGNPTINQGLTLGDTLLAGSGSLAGSLLNMTQTWNTTGTPTALKLNVTDTASNASSLLMDLQVGGSSKFKIDKAGVMTLVTSMIGTNGLFSSAVRVGSTGQFYWQTRSMFKSSADGAIEAYMADGSTFSGFQSLYERWGSGTPEGSVTAPVGAIYHRTNGGTGTSLYVKESGTGNTGWVNK